MVADVWYPAEMAEQEAGNRLVVGDTGNSNRSSEANSTAGIQPEIKYEPSSRLTAAASGGPSSV